MAFFCTLFFRYAFLWLTVFSLSNFITSTSGASNLGVNGALGASPLLYLPTSAFVSPKESTYWNDVPIAWKEIENRIEMKIAFSDKNLTASQQAAQYYFANIQMLSMLLFLNPKNRQALYFYDLKIGDFLPLLFSPESSLNFTDVQSFSPFYLLSLRVGEEKPYFVSVEKQREWQNAIESFYLKNPKEAVDTLFKLFQWIQTNLLPSLSSKQNYILASALNAWYQSLDPFAKLIAANYYEANTPPLSITEQMEKLRGTILDIEPNEKIAYIHLQDFSQTSMGAIVEKLQSLTTEMKALALIIDLRGNSGGTLDKLKLITSIFFPSDKFYPIYLNTSFNDSSPIQTETTFAPWTTNIPLFLIIDASTKSTAELFAGIIQYYKRGILIGAPTFGKGVYTMQIPMFLGKAYFQQSIDGLYLLNGTNYHTKGISPDVSLPKNLLSSRQAIQIYSNLKEIANTQSIAFKPLPKEWQIRAWDKEQQNCFNTSTNEYFMNPSADKDKLVLKLVNAVAICNLKKSK